MVVYGESKEKIGNIIEIKYHILPLPCLADVGYVFEMFVLEDQKGDISSSVISINKRFSWFKGDPITIKQSLRENASSVIYTIGAFEKIKQSNFTAAISFFKAVENYEDNFFILYYISYCHFLDNDFNESVQYLDKATEIDTQFIDAWNNKGVILWLMGRYEEAIADIDKAIKINTQFSEAWNNKGTVLCELDKYEEAIAAYDNATEINPQDDMAWYNKGMVLCELGKYEEAIAAYDEAIKIDDYFFKKAWFKKGVILCELGKYEEAIAAYDNATTINPQLSATLHYTLRPLYNDQ